MTFNILDIVWPTFPSCLVAYDHLQHCVSFREKGIIRPQPPVVIMGLMQPRPAVHNTAKQCFSHSSFAMSAARITTFNKINTENSCTVD